MLVIEMSEAMAAWLDVASIVITPLPLPP